MHDSYIVIVICCLYNVKHASWDHQLASLNSALSLTILGLLIIYPLWMQCFLYYRRHHLRTEVFKKKYSNAYRGLEEKDLKFLAYPLFFYYRRILIPLSIILFPQNMIAHYLTLTLSGIATMVLIGVKKPFKSRSRNTVEILEESVIIVLMYHMFCFTDWIDDPMLQFVLGYSVIGFVLSHLFLFLFISSW